MSELERYRVSEEGFSGVWEAYKCDDVDNQECKWDDHIIYDAKERGYKFCPYCGGKIKEVK